jgi:hypothetical protein
MGAPVPVAELERGVALRRFLDGQHRLDRGGDNGVVEVADGVVGLRATSPATPYRSSHERVRAFTCGDLDPALYGERSLLRVKAMRDTVFVASRRLVPFAFSATRATTLAADRRWLGVSDDGRARLGPEAVAALAIVAEAVAVDVVPMLDPYTMGDQDRSRLVDPQLNEVVVDRGGNVTSVVARPADVRPGVHQTHGKRLASP